MNALETKETDVSVTGTTMGNGSTSAATAALLLDNGLAGAAQDEAASTVVITDAERRILRRLLAGVRAGRTGLTSEDARVAAGAGELLLSIIAYTTGFLDGKGVTLTHSGYSSVISPTPGNADLDTCLDTVEKMLDTLAAPRTRIVIGAVVLILGAELVVGGIGMRMIADALEARADQNQ